MFSRRAVRALASVWLALGCSVTPAFALADQGRILLVAIGESDGGWPRAEQRTEAELVAMGLTVRRASEPRLTECVDDAATRAAIGRAGALGALELRLLPGPPPTLRVCVVELVTGKAVLRHLEVASGLPPAQAALLAVELVHASLLEVRASHPSRGQVRPSKAVSTTVDQKLTRELKPWLGLRLGAAVLGSPGGISPNVASAVGLEVPATEHLAFDADGAFAVLPGSATRDEGTATVRLMLGRAHAAYPLWASPGLNVALGVGGGFVAARVAGEAAEPYRPSAGVGTTWLISSAMQARLALSREWWLRLDSHLGYAPDPLRVTFASASRAELGQPLLDAGLSLEWRALR